MISVEKLADLILIWLNSYDEHKSFTNYVQVDNEHDLRSVLLDGHWDLEELAKHILDRMEEENAIRLRPN
jgi:hypothetical protein